jgi:CubicO group peptidase (beta-lactamase class C family)
MGAFVMQAVVALALGAQEAGAKEAAAPASQADPLDALVAELDALRKKSGVPGVSFALMEGGTIVKAVGLGVRRQGGEQPVDATTIFQVGSVSKPVAALGALRMVADGRLALDRDVGEWLASASVPDGPLRNGKAITLRGILSHTAGLSVHGFAGYLEGERVPDLLDVLAGAPPANSPPIVVELEPGTKRQYSGGGYCVMQQTMIDVAGKPFPELLDELVFQPLAMTRSAYAQPLPERLRDNASAGHAWPPKPLRGDAPTHPELAAAGLWSTASDLLRFGNALQRAWAGEEGAILPRELARDALTAVGPGDDFGLGFQLFADGGVAAFGHGGSNQGFRALIWFARDRQDGFVLLTNGDGGDSLIAPAQRTILERRGWLAKKEAQR